jgi:hypothetical protein
MLPTKQRMVNSRQQIVTMIGLAINTLTPNREWEKE